MMTRRRVSVADRGGRRHRRVQMMMSTRISTRGLIPVTRARTGTQRTGVAVNVAGQAGRQISMMVRRYSLRAVRMMHGRRPVMMGDVRGLGVAVVMMSVLSLSVLLKSHQSIRDVQIRGASEIVGVLVHVRVAIADVEMPVDVAFRRCWLVMMLIRIQNVLLDVLQLVFAVGAGRFLR